MTRVIGIEFVEFDSHLAKDLALELRSPYC
jgi:hypothetical protein